MRVYELIDHELYEKMKNNYVLKELQMNLGDEFKYIIFLIDKEVQEKSALTFLQEMNDIELFDEMDDKDKVYFCVVSNFESPQFKR
ncbi:hypothetical protein [Macrococcoides canis]|uniref:hypothetical protein n=1 Tax=Macrococcoides canis TaxID=1855823 RepID=UPI0022B92DEF|nr:hypothetical protein [Macrococcus canis]WBF53839.1 hypothetical protein LL975_05980 [Macrococcus canis]